MATTALIGKDVREHGAAAIGLLVASLALVALAIAQNREAAFSMSPFEVVRFALITFVPLIVLTVGNRLIVREYLSGTRLFVEALPVGSLRPLLIKYLLGALFLSLLALVLLASCVLGSSAADDVTPLWLGQLLLKTLVVMCLYWSIVFCFSLCGHLRIVLYLVTLGIVALVAWMPAIDATRFAPFRLLDRDLFVFERDLTPVVDMLWTLGLAAAFVVTGFVIARLGNGSVAERLARPMTRRDFVVLGVLVVAGAGLAGAIAENRTREPIRFGNNTVLRVAEPAIEMYFASEAYRARSEAFLQSVQNAIEPMQARLGIDALPITRLALRPSRERHDIDYGTLDGVYVAANWLEHDSYDDSVLVAVVLHGLLTARTAGRAPFEPHHWVLDGFTRWWAETLGDPESLRDSHRDELLARAVFVVSRLDQEADLVTGWQGIADNFGYPSAEALAFSAVLYVAETQGVEAVFALGRSFLAEPVGASVLASLADRRRPAWQRFQEATGTTRNEFTSGWATWLASQAREPGVAAQLGLVPSLDPVFSVDSSDPTQPAIVAGYRQSDSGTPGDVHQDARCFLRYGALSAFDYEFEVGHEDERESLCAADEAAHRISGLHGAGDRVYVALEFESPDFHQPLRLGARRLEIP
jgi:hypothetical protein